MNIKVLTEDFRNATNYNDANFCPLAVAVKRQLDVYDVSIFIGNVNIKYKMGDNWKRYDVTYDWRKEQRIYGGEYGGMDIDDMVELAKSNPDIEFPEVELELVAGEF